MNLNKTTKQELLGILDDLQREIDRLKEEKKRLISKLDEIVRINRNGDQALREKSNQLKRAEFEHRLNLLAEIKSMNNFLSVSSSGATHREKEHLTARIKEQFEKKAEELTNQLYNSNYYDSLPF